MVDKYDRDEELHPDVEAENEQEAVNMALGSSHMDNRDKPTLKKHIEQAKRSVNDNCGSFDKEDPYRR